jgi:hypothetical protein
MTLVRLGCEMTLDEIRDAVTLVYAERDAVDANFGGPLFTVSDRDVIRRFENAPAEELVRRPYDLLVLSVLRYRAMEHVVSTMRSAP